MSEPLLEIRDLVVRAGATTILDGVGVRVAPGEILGVIGESGAGKSTLGLAALGYFRAGCHVARGSVAFAGTQVLSLAPGQLRRFRRRRVAYVAQSAAGAFNPAHRLGAQVIEVPRIEAALDRNGAAALAAKLFARLDLPEPGQFGRRFPHQVSGGQLQRAMTAMALAAEPQLVVFDEPTTALDVTTQREVLRAIRAAIATRRLAALYISHDIAVVAEMADRILVLRHGRMVEEAPTRTLMAAPREAYTRALIGARRSESGARAAAPPPPPVLAASDVTAGYGRDPPALADVSFELGEGSVLAVVGQSGSGKSTLARVITGLLPPRAGRLRFAGEPLPAALGSRKRELRRRIQLIHQSPDVSLNPRQTVGEIVGRPLAFFHGADAAECVARVGALLDAVELPAGLAARLPASLSGGQKQRVCIARALAAAPDLLICDEITSALDPLIEDSIVRLLSRIRRERRLALIVITHDLALARRFAEDAVVLHRGRIVERGPVAEVFGAPRDPYTRRLVAAVPSLEPGWLDRPPGDMVSPTGIEPVTL